MSRYGTILNVNNQNGVNMIKKSWSLPVATEVTGVDLAEGNQGSGLP